MPPKVGDAGSVPIPHAEGQLSLHALEPTHPNQRSPLCNEDSAQSKQQQRVVYNTVYKILLNWNKIYISLGTTIYRIITKSLETPERIQNCRSQKL